MANPTSSYAATQDEMQDRIDRLTTINLGLTDQLQAVVALRDGEFFAQSKDIWESQQVSYKGGFTAICGRLQDSHWRENRFQVYKNLECELTKKATSKETCAEDLTLESESISDHELGAIDQPSRVDGELKVNREKNRLAIKSRSMSSSVHSNDQTFMEGVKLVDTGTETNSGHLLAGNNSCSPTMGIFVQAIIGKDLESVMDKQIKTAGNVVEIEALKEKKIRILQQLAYHKKLPYKGFCNLENNTVQVPKGGHEKIFDKQHDWIIVPIMTLDSILKWHERKGGYWVAAIAGDPRSYRNLVNTCAGRKDSEQSPADVYVLGKREKCNRDDIVKVVDVLHCFVKAFADLATGRGEGERKLNPLNLVREDKKPGDLAEIEVARNKLLEPPYEVTVPMIKDGINIDEMDILKLYINHDHDPSRIPEPMAFAGKAALNFMSSVKEKATPGCGEDSSDEEDSQWSPEVIPISGEPSTPPQEVSGIPQNIAVVTPPQESLELSDDDGGWDL